jgi:hypothetical protein
VSYPFHITPTVGMLAASAVLACSSAAAVPRTGTFTGAAALEQATSSGHVLLEVRRRGRARVTAARLHFAAACADGSSIERDVDLGGMRVSRRGRFSVTDTSGGNFAAHGRIRVTVTLRGRFDAPMRASGAFRAGAIVTSDTFAPSVACHTGTVQWAASRRPAR